MIGSPELRARVGRAIERLFSGRPEAAERLKRRLDGISRRVAGKVRKKGSRSSASNAIEMTLHLDPKTLLRID